MFALHLRLLLLLSSGNSSVISESMCVQLSANSSFQALIQACHFCPLGLLLNNGLLIPILLPDDKQIMISPGGAARKR